MLWFGLAWLGLVWFGLVWFGLRWLGLVWFGLVWFGLVCLARARAKQTAENKQGAARAQVRNRIIKAK